MNIMDCKTSADLLNYAEAKEKELRMLKSELELSEKFQARLNEENLRLIDKNEELELKVKGLKQMLQPYKDKIQELIDENEKLKGKSFAPKTREITDEQIQDIKKLREEGLSYRDIEKATGWSKFTIGKVIKGEYD